MIANTDTTIQQILRQVNRAGMELCREEPTLPILQKQMELVGTGNELIGALEDLIPDYGYPIHDTDWDRTQIWPVMGPVSPQEWQALKARGIVGVFSRYRIKIDPDTNKLSFYTYPAADLGHTIFGEYISKNFCAGVNATTGALTGQSAFAADTDIGLIEEHLLELEAEWRWKKLKGFPDWPEFQREALTYKNNLRGQDQGSRTFTMLSRPVLPYVPTIASVQDGNYPSPTT